MRHLVTDKDTICALATAHGVGAISVIRISGSHASSITRKIAPFLPPQLESHKIYYGFLRSLDQDQVLDEVLVAYFQEGRSFTGESSFEISCHGGEVVVTEILRQLVQAGARPANRGEFTCRAFMNGRLDLVQAESVLALIESRSRRAVRLALDQLRGDLSKILNDILKRLTGVLAHLEANIDFASEDIEISPSDQLAVTTENILEDVNRLLATYKQGRVVRSGYQVAIIGSPNVGKSSLLNALTGEDKAIVTAIPGTTRDFVEAQIANEGFAINLIDTAGLRITDDPVEKIGVQRTLEKINQADVILYVRDGSENEDERDEFFLRRIPPEKTIGVVNKIDLRPEATWLPGDSSVKVYRVSASTGAGLAELTRALTDWFKQEVAEDSTLVSHARHYDGLVTLKHSLETAISLLRDDSSPDLVALELQSGIKALYEVLGLTFDDQVMDRVFSEFCLGK